MRVQTEKKPNGTKLNSPKNFVRVILPWLLGVAMLAAYAITLNRWVSPDSLYQISNLSGEVWQAELTRPISFLITFPIRWLPAVWIPLAANFFTACCAAISLGLLARCVVLLPHDRTRAQRYRNPDKDGLLGLKSAWLPPTLAVLACGLQLTFWEQSVSATGEMFDLLLFAYMVRCFLEYRLDGNSSWLLRLALVSGLAVANNWAMVAFLPVFIVALLWVQGFFQFFKSGFVARFLKEKGKLNVRLPVLMVCCWLAGVSMFFLMPFLASCFHISHINFWPGLKFAIHLYQIFLANFSIPVISGLALMTLLPVCFMGIRWGRLFGEGHPFGFWLATILFHIVHGIFLLGTLWIMLDSPVSPRNIQPFYPCLPLYFLMALSVGYFSGYFLLVFKPITEKNRNHPFSAAIPFFNVISVAAMGILLILTPAELLYKNLAGILLQRNGSLAGYLDVLGSATPGAGAVILSEDTVRLQYLQTALTRSGRQADYLLIDTGLLTHQPTYFELLDRRNPKFKLRSMLPDKNPSITNTTGLIPFLNTLARNRDLYFMHPFAGYLDELFYQQPRKLFYQLKPYPPNSAFAPAMTPELITENEAFWRTLTSKQFPELRRRLQVPKSAPKQNLFQWILDSSHIQPSLDDTAMIAGRYYSMMLDGWGVELQKAGRLPEAKNYFEEAKLLNPDNAAARINLDSNQAIQARKAQPINPALGIEESFNQHREWDQSLRQDGPVDEPNVCYRFGIILKNVSMNHQAIQQFSRAQILSPSDINVPLRLAESFLNLMQPTNALAETESVLQVDSKNSRALFLKGFALLRMEKYSRAINILNDFQKVEPNSADARLLRGYSYFKLNTPEKARAEYEQAAKLAVNPYGAYYALAELGYRTRDFALAITNCDLYLANAPAGAPESIQIKVWLAELRPDKKMSSSPPANAVKSK